MIHSLPPAFEDRSYRVRADAQQAGNRAEIGGERHDFPDVEIAIGPTVEAVAHTARAGVRLNRTGTQRGVGVVDRRVTNRALEPTDRSVPEEVKKPVTPMTAFSLSSSRLTAGSSRSTFPFDNFSSRSRGSASASIFSPAESTPFGLRLGPTPPKLAPSIVRCRLSISPSTSRRRTYQNEQSAGLALPARRRLRLWDRDPGGCVLPLFQHYHRRVGRWLHARSMSVSRLPPRRSALSGSVHEKNKSRFIAILPGLLTRRCVRQRTQ